jgi:glycerophosphoryl diester phosphodiesterase
VSGARPTAPIGFAHRGASAHAPENTLEAFALALELGATGLESDVWVTADGVAVLDHDGVVRDARGERPIAALARSELPAHVPSLRELYEAVGPGVPVSLDVKDTAAALPAIRAARDAGAEAELWLCHWSWRVVAAWREHSRAARLVDSTRLRHMRTPPAERALRMVRLGIDALNLHESEWTEASVEALHAAGRAAFGWDAQDEPTLRRLLELGLDAVYSDHADRLRAALQDAGAARSGR